MSAPRLPWTADRRPALPEGIARPDIAEQVLRHFRENDRAMDSVEGIARFWVNEDRRVVERCLEELGACGFLQKRTIAGTHFYSLPREVERGEKPAPSPAAAERPAVAAGRVLVVDDDPSVLALLADVLSAAGHQVMRAADGERAVEVFRGEPCEVVVTDVAMPGLSGMDVLRAVKQIHPSTEVILLTAFSSIDGALEALRHGAYDFLTKPIPDIGHLTRTVAHAQEKRRLSLDNLALQESLRARNQELGAVVTRMSAVSDIGRTPAGLLEVGEVYDSLARLVSQHLNASRVSVLMAEADQDSMALVGSVGIADQAGLQHRVRIGDGIAGKVAATCAPFLTANIQESELRHLAVASRYRTPSCIVVPLIVSNPSRRQSRQIGVIAASDKHSGEPFTQQNLDFLSAVSAQVSATLEHARLLREMEDGYLGALVALVHACEDTRSETRQHSKRVVDLAAATARELRLPEGRVQVLLKAAALHEAGRLARGPQPPAARDAHATAAPPAWTPEDVLATDQLLARIPTLREVREIILHSAQRHEAAALPFEVTSAPVPIESRILSVCEEYSRLEVHPGAERAAAVHALATLRRKADNKQDAEIVGALARALEREVRS